MKKVNLFCLPFAGGSRYSYRDYQQKAPSFLNLLPLEYPGRGSRMGEELLTDMEVLIEDLYQQVKPHLDERPYAIYGHSLGGLITHLLTRKILSEGHPAPLHIFVTGTTGPSAPSRKEKKRHLLPKKEFIEEIRRLDGSPEEILQNEDLLEYIEPILRADFHLNETYAYENKGPLDLPFTVITGTEEDMTMEDIKLWQLESSRPIDFRRMKGKHFFIFEHAREIMDIIARKIIVQTEQIGV